jgi:hypothetical protein
VLSVKKRVVPELNDEFAASIREGLTAEDIKKEVHRVTHRVTHGEWIGYSRRHVKKRDDRSSWGCVASIVSDSVILCLCLCLT